MEVGTQGAGHLVGKPGADRRSGDSANHLADEIALGDRVVPGCSARLPPGFLGGQHRGALFPVGQVLVLERLGPSGQAGGMTHQVAHLHGFLAAGRELGPVGGHRGMEVEFAPIGQHQGTEEGHRLGRRPDVDDGVLLPGGGLRLVDEASPDIDHRLAAHHHRHRCPDVTSIIEALRQRGDDALVLLVPAALYVGHWSAPLVRDVFGHDIAIHHVSPTVDGSGGDAQCGCPTRARARMGLLPKPVSLVPHE